MGIHDLWLFVAAGLLLNITPGPDMALVIARSTAQGMRAGMAAAIGIGAGVFVHIAAAALGISALIATSTWAFRALQWLGALYLGYIGLKMISHSLVSAASDDRRRIQPVAELRAVMVQGFLTNVLNPKVAMFFLAFLPQFIDPNAPSKAMAFVVLGLLFDATGTIWNLCIAWLFGGLGTSAWFARLQRWLERAIGTLLVAIGIKLMLSERG
jgi:RhtB (resistance to homoserine/threonine) family protein